MRTVTEAGSRHDLCWDRPPRHLRPFRSLILRDLLKQRQFGAFPIEFAFPPGLDGFLHRRGVGLQPRRRLASLGERVFTGVQVVSLLSALPSCRRDNAAAVAKATSPRPLSPKP